MKYYDILLVTYSDDTKDKVAIYSYDSKDEATANVYKYMGTYTNAENVATACVTMMNNFGAIYKSESWQAAG